MNLQELFSKKTPAVELLNALNDAVVISDTSTGKIVYVNEKMCEMHVCSGEQACSLSVHDIYCDFPRLNYHKKSSIDSRQRQEETATLECQGKRLTGELFWADISLRHVEIEGNKLLVAVVRDVSARREKEAFLQSHEEQYRSLFEHNPAPMFIYERGSTRILSVNEAFVKHYGYPRTDALSMCLSDLYPDDEKEYVVRVSANLNGYAHCGESKHRKKDGTYTPVVTQSNDIVYFGHRCRYVVVTDITSQKLAEAELVAKKKQLQAAIDASPDALIVLTDKNERILACNRRLAKLWDLTEEDIGKKSIPDVLPRELYEQRTPCYSKVLRDKTAFTFEDSFNGKIFSNSVVPIVNSDNEIDSLATYSIDVTIQKSTENILKENVELHDKFSKVVEYSPGGFYSIQTGLDGDISFSFISPIWEDIIGLRREDAYNNMHVFSDVVYPDDIDALKYSFFHALKNGEERRLEFRINHPSKGLRWIEDHAKPERLSNGEIVWFGFIIDITERKAAEEMLKESRAAFIRQNQEYQALNEELLETNAKMKRMNQELVAAKHKAEDTDRLKTLFLYNMSHEIRTPLNGIIGFADLLEDNFDDRQKLRDFTTIIKQRGTDLLNIINDILEISKIESGQLPVHTEDFKLNDILTETRHFFSAYMYDLGKSNLTLNVMPLDDEELSIHSDPVKIKQILSNLVHNAFKFTSFGSITAGCVVKESASVMEIFVIDTGIGIDKDKLDIIFDRFVKLDEHPLANKQRGTGLGLSITKALVELLGGRITVESTVGQGSKFTCVIPYEKATSGLSNLQNNFIVSADILTGKHLLIVENDELEAMCLREIARDTGMKHTLMTTIDEVREKVRSTIHPDIVLLSINSTNQDGFDACKVIKSLFPSTVLLALMSVYPGLERQTFLDAGCNDVVNKPIKKHDLLSLMAIHLTI